MVIWQPLIGYTKSTTNHPLTEKGQLDLCNCLIPKN